MPPFSTLCEIIVPKSCVKPLSVFGQCAVGLREDENSIANGVTDGFPRYAQR